MGLGREDILSKKGGKLMELEVPEWGGTVHLREMTASERDAFEQASLDKSGSARLINIRARLASISLCNSSGKRLFSDADINALGELPASALDRIFDASMKLNKISKQDVDDLEKN